MTTTALIGVLLAIAAGLIVIEVRRERRAICSGCGSRSCHGQCLHVVIEWSERERATIAKLEQSLAAISTADTLEPWRELLETL